MSLAFDHTTPRQRLRFGAGQAAEHLADEIGTRGSRRVMVIAGGSSAAVATTLTADLVSVALRYDDIAPHVPIEKAEKARAAAREHDIDLLVSIGGGSTVGLAKAIALTERIPIVAVPTTYAGSEATSMWGITEAARKATGVDEAVLPVTVIADVELTLGLPVRLSVASGLNGIAHCIDSMWAPKADPINRTHGEEGIRALAEGLTAIIADPTGIEGRQQALYGSYLAALSFASAGSGMHHKICHVLGGTYNLPHAETHATVLAYVLAFNAPAAPEAERRVARALGAERAVDGLNALRERIDAPRALRDYGFREGDIAEAASIIVTAIPDTNPRPVDEAGIASLLRAAWAGDAPEV